MSCVVFQYSVHAVKRFFYLPERCSSRSGISQFPQIGIPSASRGDGRVELCSVSIFCSCCKLFFYLKRGAAQGQTALRLHRRDVHLRLNVKVIRKLLLLSV